jgi:hypothetical protein
MPDDVCSLFHRRTWVNCLVINILTIIDSSPCILTIMMLSSSCRRFVQHSLLRRAPVQVYVGFLFVGEGHLVTLFQRRPQSFLPFFQPNSVLIYLHMYTIITQQTLLFSFRHTYGDSSLSHVSTQEQQIQYPMSPKEWTIFFYLHARTNQHEYMLLHLVLLSISCYYIPFHDMFSRIPMES